jgi:YD repeat-containing protein
MRCVPTAAEFMIAGTATLSRLFRRSLLVASPGHQTLGNHEAAKVPLRRPLLGRRWSHELFLILSIISALAEGTRASAQRLDGYENKGAIHGKALSAEHGGPVPYALVVLLPDEPGTAARSVLTDDDGRYRFERLPPGGYRVRLDRIGFQSELSPVLHLRVAEEIQYLFRTSPRPVELPGITVRLACYTADRLWQDSSLAALWREAEKALATRQAFERQYRYTYDLRQELTAQVRSGGRLVERKDTQVITLVNQPLTARSDSDRRQARQRSGFGRQTRGTLALVIPDGSELLAPEFLRDHCLEGRETTEQGVHALRFRPLRPERSRINIRGAVRIDAQTYQIRSVAVEYMRGHAPFMEGRIEYADVGVPNGVLRLPWRGVFSGRPPGAMRRSMTEVVGTVTFQNHRELQRVSSEAAEDP